MMLTILLTVNTILLRESFRKLKRHCLDPVELPFPCMHGFTDFYNPVYLFGGRVPLTTCRLSPSERNGALPLL